MFRTYVYLLKPSKKQILVLNTLKNYISLTHELFLKLFKEYEQEWLIEFKKISITFYETHKLSSYFINNVLEQLIYNFNNSLNKDSVQSCYPICFKNTHFTEDKKHINFPFLQNVKLSHYRDFNGTVVSHKLFYKEQNFYIHSLIKIPSVTKKSKNLSVVGIDMGLKSFLTLSTGVSIDNPRFETRLSDRIKFHQKRLRSKVPHSLAWRKEIDRINSLHKKIKRQRTDFFHYVTNYLVENFDVIGIENLAIGELQSKKQLRLSLKDASWGEFIRILEYKCEQEGKHLIKVGRFFPSSQICSSCGSRKFMPVHQRTYQCNYCNKQVDRDYNASINIERRALELYNSSN